MLRQEDQPFVFDGVVVGSLYTGTLYFKGRSISGFSRIGDAGAAALARLRADLDNGNWMRRYGHLLHQTAMDCGYRLIVAEVR